MHMSKQGRDVRPLWVLSEPGLRLRHCGRGARQVCQDVSSRKRFGGVRLGAGQHLSVSLLEQQHQVSHGTDPRQWL